MSGRLLVILTTLVLASCDTRTITFRTPTPIATAALPSATTSAKLPPTPTAAPASPATPTRSPAASASASAVASATVTVTIPPGASLAPLPPQPPLAADVSVVGTGSALFAVAPGETRRFEPADLARQAGLPTPASARLAWTVAWRATGVLAAAWYRQAATIELGSGRWGTADLGASGFELRNEADATVVGELAFTIGSR